MFQNSDRSLELRLGQRLTYADRTSTETDMFGRPKSADGAFLISEISHGLSATANALEDEHPNLASSDTQAIMVWVYSITMHAIMMWGRTNRDTIYVTAGEFASMMSQAPDEGKWGLDFLASEIERCQGILRDHVQSLDYDGIKAAPSAYFQGFVTQGLELQMSEEEFVRFGVTTILASMERLRRSGHICLR